MGYAVLIAAGVATALGPYGNYKATVLFTVVPGVAMLPRPRRRPRPRAARRGARRPRRAAGARARAARQRGGGRRARPDRARAARPRGAQRERDGRPGRRRAPRARTTSRPSTREALASIEQAGRQALAEARRLLGMLRRDGRREALEPQPGVEQLDVLVEQVERAGLPVALDVEGEPRRRCPPASTCAPTGSSRRGSPTRSSTPARAHAEVRAALRARERSTSRSATTARGAAAGNGDGAGHGLIGMRERVALYGGALRGRPARRRRLRDRAPTLPLRDERRAS